MKHMTTEHHCRNLKNFGVPAWLVRKYNADTIKARLKEKGVVPEDAHCIAEFDVQTQDAVMWRYCHPSFPRIHGLDVLQNIGVDAEDLGLA